MTYDPFRDGDLFSGAKKTGKAFAAWFVFCALMAVIFLGVVIWAIVKVVNHYT